MGRTASVENPSGAQNFVEAVVEFVDSRVSETFKYKNELIGPLLDPPILDFVNEHDGPCAG